MSPGLVLMISIIVCYNTTWHSDDRDATWNKAASDFTRKVIDDAKPHVLARNAIDNGHCRSEESRDNGGQGRGIAF